MKRIAVISFSVSLLVVGYCVSNNINKNSVNQNSTTTVQGKTNMARIKIASEGLEYEILQEGTGISPKVKQTVTVHYTGWLDKDGVPGKKFDSSVDRGQPFSFVIGIGQVIRGWDEGVLSMKIGEKRRLFIPSKLAYGKSGAGRIIPPDAALIFDVELLKVQ